VPGVLIPIAVPAVAGATQPNALFGYFTQIQLLIKK
jgi:hypothetical protein